MKQFNSFATAQAFKPAEKLPVGNYILEIKDAEEVTFNNGGSALKVSFDIADGDHKGFYTNDYRNQTGEDKRWKGTLLLYVPKEDGSKEDGWTANSFKGNIEAIEESNPGYHWDWNEQGLKGKKVGGIFFEKEWEFNGRTGMTTACKRFATVEQVKSGTIKTPEPKMLAGKSAPLNVPINEEDFEGFEELDTDDADPPF